MLNKNYSHSTGKSSSPQISYIVLQTVHLSFALGISSPDTHRSQSGLVDAHHILEGKQWYIYTMKHYSAVGEKNDIMKFPANRWH